MLAQMLIMDGLDSDHHALNTSLHGMQAAINSPTLLAKLLYHKILPLYQSMLVLYHLKLLRLPSMKYI